ACARLWSLSWTSLHTLWDADSDDFSANGYRSGSGNRNRNDRFLLASLGDMAADLKFYSERRWLEIVHSQCGCDKAWSGAVADTAPCGRFCSSCSRCHSMAIGERG